MNQDVNAGSCDICLATLNLTEQMSAHALHQCLTDIMKNYFHAIHVSFYHVHHLVKKKSSEDAWRLHADEAQYHEVQSLLKSKSLKECLSYQNIAEEQQEKKIRYHVPIPLVKGALGVLVFDISKALNAYQHDKLEKLTHLFRNCDAHLTAFHHDVLTGLANRMALNEAMKRQLLKHQKKYRRQGEVEDFSSVCMLDIDFFKRVNDNFGHLYGDEVLLLFSRLMRECFRDEDQLFRYGGEEFIVILHCFNDDETLMVLNRFREKVEAYDFPQVGKVTVSVGFSRFKAGVLPSEVLEYADKALYFAKDHGRNQVASYQALLEAGHLVQKSSDHQAEIF
ncbi:MAG: GGDEF domain-containing protein [Zetaproteobacteria bacterium]|nr:GGDEF domain-containing protein [Zetaproteobacteria bacterium]